MKKLKKCQRVENYLNKLFMGSGFNLEELEKLKHTALLGIEELEGIGDRTISNVLNRFKIKKGLEPRKNEKSKKEIVEEYLANRMNNSNMSLPMLLELKYKDLKYVKELEGIGKTTITCALSDFKKKHDRKSFEKGVLDFLSQEKRHTRTKPSLAASESNMLAETNSDYKMLKRNPSNRQTAALMSEDIELIREMIVQYKSKSSFEDEKHAYELRELKHALTYLGIDPGKLIRMYWKDISKSADGQSVHPSEFPIPQSLSISSPASV